MPLPSFSLSWWNPAGFCTVAIFSPATPDLYWEPKTQNCSLSFKKKKWQNSCNYNPVRNPLTPLAKLLWEDPGGERLLPGRRREELFPGRREKLLRSKSIFLSRSHVLQWKLHVTAIKRKTWMNATPVKNLHLLRVNIFNGLSETVRRTFFQQSRWSRPQRGWRSQWGAPWSHQWDLVGLPGSPWERRSYWKRQGLYQAWFNIKRYLDIIFNFVVGGCVKMDLKELQLSALDGWCWKRIYVIKFSTLTHFGLHSHFEKTQD